MDTKYILLQLVLRELRMEPTIDSLDDRIRLQKAIYLAQEGGVPLGYRFSWYLRGPYSPGLTSDYYNLEVAIEDEPDGTRGKKLRVDLEDKLRNIRPIMSVPSSVELRPTEWLELASSIHYLFKTVGKSDPERARKKLEEIKPRLSLHVEDAERALASVGLVPHTEDR